MKAANIVHVGESGGARFIRDEPGRSNNMLVRRSLLCAPFSGNAGPIKHRLGKPVKSKTKPATAILAVEGRQQRKFPHEENYDEEHEEQRQEKHGKGQGSEAKEEPEGRYFSRSPFASGAKGPAGALEALTQPNWITKDQQHPKQDPHE